MKCEFCKTYLNHLALKDVFMDNELIFSINCINPHCRKVNYMGQEAYLRLRDDLIKLTQPIPYIKNVKLPSEMNVIFVSMGRCGISWIIRVISQIHSIMFGFPIDFHVEISHVIATRDRFPVPEGWSCVYDVDPQILVNRGYDKVIIVQREYETMRKVHTIYEDIHERNQTLLRKFDKIYEKVYGKQIDHPNCMKVNLEDLNAYTVAIFEELLEFLNFPETGRPVIVPVKPSERKWEVYSSILKKGRKVNKRLQEIDKLYDLLDDKKDYE